jgi:pimeloyl-ACP methyl ester carboxylesterase
LGEHFEREPKRQGMMDNRNTALMFERVDAPSLAYRVTEGRKPGVIFLPGFRSDMMGGKAIALEAWCKDQGRAFLRLDYSGHGESEGAFTDGTIGAWADDAITLLDEVTEGSQILVGSSMGGWIMMLMARQRPERVVGLVGIAAAPDFTEDMKANMTPEIKNALERDGVWLEPSEYSEDPTPITLKLLEDNAQNLVLNAPLPIACPVRLIHGMRDPDVPWQKTLKIAEQLASENVEIVLSKDGEHRLSGTEDIDRMIGQVAELCRLAEQS